jgi:hypothetical protein
LPQYFAQSADCHLQPAKKSWAGFCEKKRLSQAVPSVLMVVVIWQSGTVMWQTALTEGCASCFVLVKDALLSDTPAHHMKKFED